MAETAKALRERRAPLVSRIRQMADLANKENRDFSAEESAEWRKINDEYNALTTHIERAERAEQLEREQSVVVADKQLGRDDYDGRDQTRCTADAAGSGRSATVTEEDRAEGFAAWCRHQMGMALTERQDEVCRRLRFNPSSRSLDIPLLRTSDFRSLQRQFQGVHPSRRNQEMFDGQQLEQRALSAYTQQAGSYIVAPQALVRRLEVNMLAFGGMRQVAETITTSSGERMTWPTASDISNTGEQLGESGPIGSSVDPSFGAVAWDAYKFSSKPILVPYELFEDSVFDLATLLGDMLGERLGRITNTRYTTGSGAATPRGILTAAAVGKTTASATAIAADELFDLVHSIDPAYRMGAGWMMHDNVLLYLRKLKDGNGQYLWQSGMNAGAPDRLIDYPITINQDMPNSVATTNKTLLFGQLSKYKIRRVGSVRLYRLEERYRDNDQDGFVAFIREDGNLLEAGTSPVKCLQQA